MSTTEALSPPIPAQQPRRWFIPVAGVILGAILVVVAFGIGRALLDNGPTHTHPAVVTTAPPQLEPLGTAAQLNAAFGTPEGRAALAREFAPGYFGGHPSSSLVPSASSPVSPSTFDTPEGRAALAHEFAPGYFGGHPSTSTIPSASSPASPSTTDAGNCIGRGPC